MDKRLEKLEQSLDDLRKSNRSAWNTYGSELCAGGMIAEEKVLEDEIANLKKELSKQITNSTNKRFLL